MKKRILFILTLLLGIVNLNFIFAQQSENDSGTNQTTEQNNGQSESDSNTTVDNLDELDNLDNLDEENLGDENETGNNVDNVTNWGYKDSDNVVVKEVGPNYVVIQAPVVKVSDNEKIKHYRVYYSTKSLAENIDATQVKSKTFTFDNISGDNVEFKIDGLTPSTTYYLVVVPVNAEDVEGDPSKEINFTTESKEKPKEEPKEESKEEHPAPQVVLENVSYVITGNKINVKWSPVKGADKIEIYSKSINDPDYKKIGEVKSDTTSYTVQVTKPGEYQIKLTPVNAEGVPVGKDYILTVKVEKIVKKEIKKAPKVGPELSFIFMILFLASLGYVLIRYKRV